MFVRILVVAQFATWVVLVYPGPALWLPGAGVALITLGGVGVAWAMAVNPPRNFNIVPAVKRGARLVTAGPYRYVRHPIYAAALVFFAGFVALWPGWTKAAAWLVLAAVCVAKARLEEAALRVRFPEYDAYRRGRRFLIPGIW